MREIKFRAWDGKDMYYDVVVVDGKAFKNEKYIGFPLQYIGLKDKNKFNVYEGDIVFYEEWGRNYIITWDDKGTGYYLFDPKSEYTIYDAFGCDDHLIMEVINQCEVIGNIYENLELLSK